MGRLSRVSVWRGPSSSRAYTWKLTVRCGSDVEHASFEGLDEAVAEMRRRALEIRAGGPLETVSMLRDVEPGEQVRARLQLSGKGWLRKPVGGVDVMGDGAFVPYRGRLRREKLDPIDHPTPFDAVRKTLEES